MYRRLTRFLLPLVITIVVQEFGGQILNAGMARMPNATETLAAFGLAWGLILFLASPLAQSKQMSLVLVDGRHSFRKTWRFVLVFALLLMALQASLVLTPLGDWVIDDLHGIDPHLSSLVRAVLLWLVPVPLLRSTTLFLSGTLIRARRTDVISYATMGSIVFGIATVFILLSLDFIRSQPIWLPILATYTTVLVELFVVLWGFRRYVDLSQMARPSAQRRPLLSYAYIIRFFWPLALIMLVQDVSRPVINLFIARGPEGTLALAVLTVVYALGQWPYRWLNEIRNLPPAFHHEDKTLAHIRRFTLASGLLSFAISVVLFWTPLRVFILQRLIGVDPALAVRCRIPLLLYAFFSFVVMVRAYLHGVGLLEHRTQAMAPSAPSRVSAILLALVALPALGIQGATLGVAALLAGFCAETLAVWWGVRGWSLVKTQVQARGYST